MLRLIRASEKTAMVGKDLKLTYNQILQSISEYSSFIPGVKGQRIIIYSENRPEWVFSLFATWEKESIVVPVDTMSTVDDVAYIINDSKPGVIFTSADKFATIEKALEKSNVKPELFVFENINKDLGTNGRSRRKDVETEMVINDLNRTALILYTSGTTGKPKGVMLSFENILTNLIAVCDDVKIFTPDDRVMILLPLHHILPLVGSVIAPLYAGGTIVLSTSMAAEELLATLNRFSVTIMIGVPRLYQLIYKGLREKIRSSMIARALLGIAHAADSIKFSKKIFATVQKRFGGKIKYLVSGGASINPAVVRFFTDLGFELLEGYGMTETAPMITFTRPGTIRPGIPGQALPGIKVKFVDDEIVVSGRNVMQGYYNKPAETAEVLRDGWLYTGDLGFMDEDGYLHITGRKKEIIVLSNGKKINPEELEQVIMEQSPLVRETGIFAAEDVIQAIIVPDFKKISEEGLTEIEEYFRQNVIAKANNSLAPYKRILRFHIVSDELPKTRLGKIKRYLLPQMSVKKEKTLENEPGIHEYKAVKKFLEEELQKDVFPDDHLELDLALDSLGKVSLSAFIETAFGVEIHESSFHEFQSVAKLAEYIHEKKIRLSFEGISWSHILMEKINLKIKKPVFTHTLLWASVKLIMNSFMRIKAKGMEEIPDQPCIIAPNHQSILDGFLIFSLLKRRVVKNTFIYAKEKHFRNPVLKFMANRNNIILVDINRDLKHSIQKMAEVLKKGKNLLIFPEGTRSLSGRLGDFKQTFAILSQELNVPVIPVAIMGSYDVLPAGSRFPRLFRKVTVEFLPPVSPGDHSYDSLRNKIRQQLADYLD
jgi:long-chain acyl-CoA synthetase